MGTCPSQLHQLHLEGIPGTWDSLGIIVSRLTRKMVFLHLIELSCSYQLFFKKGENTHTLLLASVCGTGGKCQLPRRCAARDISQCWFGAAILMDCLALASWGTYLETCHLSAVPNPEHCLSYWFAASCTSSTRTPLVCSPPAPVQLGDTTGLQFTFTQSNWDTTGLQLTFTQSNWDATGLQPTCTSPACPRPSASCLRWVADWRCCCGMSPTQRVLPQSSPLSSCGSTQGVSGWAGTCVR